MLAQRGMLAMVGFIKHIVPMGFKIAALFMCLAFAACTNDTTLADLRKSDPKPEMARIVVAYPAPVMGDNGLAQVRYNKGAFCDLPSGSYSVHEVKAGPEKLAFSFCGVQGGTEITLQTEAGGKYYIRILPYDSSLRGIVSGYPSENLPDSRIRTRKAPPARGPFQVEIVEEAQAFEMLADLQPAAAK